MWQLGNWSGVGSWVMTVGTAPGWWYSVIRDHQKDDLPYLQRQIELISKHLQTLGAMRVPGAGAGEEALPGGGPSPEVCKRDRVSAELERLRQQYLELLNKLNKRKKSNMQKRVWR